jgi:hypothetical protein
VVVDERVQLGEDEDRSALVVAGHALMFRLREAFPRFESRWAEHLAFWSGEPAGAYNDIGPFSHFIDEELFIHGEKDEVRRAFFLIEELFLSGSQSTRDLIGIGFIEDLRNISSHRVNGHETLIPYLPPTLLRVWNDIARQWIGRSSLADVIRAERAWRIHDADRPSLFTKLLGRLRKLRS